MKENLLIDLSLEFSVIIVQTYKDLCSKNKEFVLSKQLLRSGTSIGANINEANYAISKPDFINKMHIALKETAETEYWIMLLEKSGYIDANTYNIRNKCLSLKRILISSINTCKKMNNE
ncbi:four helix bundle protein [Clostridium sp.]|uniref:four helix bundle protein n=1 Tax=Clostridium sp. TaxID=1506 RepID=UPI00260C7CA7|nr:four helix bundle protein [Clostridium sp.]